MELQDLLKDFIVADPIEKWTKELNEVYQGKRNHPLLTQLTAELGLYILNIHPDLKEEKNKWIIIEGVVCESVRYRQIYSLIPAEGWKTPEMKNLLIFFFGQEKAEYVAYAWEQIRFQMYQTGYLRRSFRAPQNRKLYFTNQINFLVESLPQVFTRTGYPEYKRIFFALDVAQQARYDHYFGGWVSLFRMWSAALDLGNNKLFQVFEDIIFNKDNTGKVTRNIIKALLNSRSEAAWELVKKLLLAAQRQEGLRQTILEALDETSVEALKFIIKALIDHNLTRFSSVVRSVDVWAGLGWAAERESSVKKFLEKAQEYLENPEKIPSAVKSLDNADVYMALWAQGVYDIEETIPFLHELYAKGSAEKRSLAIKFALETNHSELSLALYDRALEDNDLMVLAWVLRGLNGLKLEKFRNDRKFPRLFGKLHKIMERTDSKEKTFEGKIFSWTNISFNRKDALQAMIRLIGEDEERLQIVLSYFAEMSVDLREQLTRHILKDYAGYRRDDKKNTPPLSDLQRDYAIKILPDKGEFMVSSAFIALKGTTFTDKEMQILQGLLKRKGADFRAKIISLILQQPDEKVAAATENLLTVGDGEQRLAGLDIALQLQKSNRLEKEIKKWTKNFRNRKAISAKEEILLAQVTELPEKRQDYSFANGYGLFAFKKAFSPIIKPIPNPESYYERQLAKNEFGFSVALEKVTRELEKLAALYFENKDYEYEVENWDNSRQTVLLGNTFREIKLKLQSADPRENYRNYPLPEVWEKWYQQSGLQPVDLYIISLSNEPKSKNILPYYSDIMPAAFRKNHYHNNPLLQIINALLLIHEFVEKDQFLLGACTRLFSALEESVLKADRGEKQQYYANAVSGWQTQNIYHTFYYRLDAARIADNLVKELWNLEHWRQFAGTEENTKSFYPSLITFCRAFEQKIISEDELYRGIMTNTSIQELSRKSVRTNEFNYFKRFPFLQPMYEKVREQILDIELKRGDSATEVSPLAASFNEIYGAQRFVEILVGLGNTSLNRGYSYYTSNYSKQTLFSKLLKICQPAESETQKVFDELVKKAQISEDKLIEAAVYAPQWQKFVSRHLNWKGLDSAIWWMHAHTKIPGYQEQNAEAESEIAKYSSVDLEEFRNGAVDKDWFRQAYQEIGKSRWEIVYNAAKYISDGNGHRRARLYSDVISGRIKLKEIVGKVKNKRDQDYLRIYGLVPLSKNGREKDVLIRYAYLQKFKKESKQFGAQKQASEAIAVQIALENLARNADYEDPLRLSWAMETRQVQEILAKGTEIRDGDTVVKLAIDDEGKAEIVVNKGGQELRSIPPKLKKDKKYLELSDYKKTLKEQFSRSRQSLEEAMVRGDKFNLSELVDLFTHPVISKHLEKLVFLTEKGSGFFKNSKLISATEKETDLSATDKIRLAHCLDLFNSGEWSDYQRHCFDNKLKQPFKQIFRELYLPTEDELREKSVSRRYAGHQVQPKQTVALLKSRGWKVDYEEGLQKVFHREGFAAKMYALADWFSPAEIESPTLETVVFENIKDGKNRPFEELEERIFSEVMRDIDLVVSVAHAGGIDAEASHSAIQMRSVLLRETLRLFKLNNVELAGNHARIKGALGEYSVHLGSAVVHKTGKYLSILPVHSQHRGRLFLPFADDDPKSAEVISKVLLLSRDNEIQDPTILRQLS